MSSHRSFVFQAVTSLTPKQRSSIELLLDIESGKAKKTNPLTVRVGHGNTINRPAAFGRQDLARSLRVLLSRIATTVSKQNK